jgi:hypothetical protein
MTFVGFNINDEQFKKNYAVISMPLYQPAVILQTTYILIFYQLIGMERKNETAAT